MPHLIRRLLLTVAALLLAPTLLCAKPPSQTLTYTSLQPGKWDLFLFDGAIPHNITNGKSLNYNPVFSPDGHWLVFTSERLGTAHLFYKDMQQIEQPATRLTDSDHFEDQASFSPNGKVLYFTSARDGTADIFSMPFDPNNTTDLQQTKNLTHDQGNNFRARISPDGKWIVFSSNRAHPAPNISNPAPAKNYRATDIYKMKIDGSQVTRLTTNNQWDGAPTWSKDGKTIFFYSTVDKLAHIYKMDSNGDNPQRISPKIIEAVTPTMMPNGRIAFAGKFDGHWTIASVKEDGSDLAYESDNRINYYGPVFHPKTGQLIAYGDGPVTEQPFLNEPAGGIYQGELYIDKPLGIGAFSINHYQHALPDRKLNIQVTRGYFPNYAPETASMLSVKEFSKVVRSSGNGEQMQTLFHPDGLLIGLSWSPKLDWFVAGVGAPFSPASTKVDIWKVAKNGNKKNLTKQLPGNNAFPRISHDGKLIVFRGGKNGAKQIFSMHSDGTHLKQLTFGNEVDTMPAISPNGKWIAYSSIHKGKNYNLYLVSTSGKQPPIQLTNNPYADVHPIFSPDGKWVAFSSERGGLMDETPLIPVFCAQPYGDIYAIRVSDHKVIRLTETKWESSLPDWK